MYIRMPQFKRWCQKKFDFDWNFEGNNEKIRLKCFENTEEIMEKLWSNIVEVLK